MSYGIQINNASGTRVFDSTRYGGVVVAQIILYSGQSGTQQFPRFIWREIFVSMHFMALTHQQYAQNSYSVSYPGGVPTISYSLPANVGGPLYLTVMVR